jgi:hypothetical protein
MSNIGLKIRNENEQQVVDIMTRCHDWLAKELDIESKMEFGRTCNWGHDAFHAGLWYNSTKQSVLNFRNLYGANMYTLLKIVAHEARHAVQYKTGMLVEEGRNNKTRHDGRWEYGTWNGEYYSGPYKEAPWEIDARAHEEPYAQMVIDAGIISQEELGIKLAARPGDTDHMIVRLDTETHDDIREKYGRVSLWQAAVQSRKEDQANAKRFEDLVKPYFIKNEGRNYSFNHKFFESLVAQQMKIENIAKENKTAFGKIYKFYKKEFDKVWKDAKKETKLKYRDDAVAFLTLEETAKLKKAKATKNDMFWAAQKNVVEYKTRPATEDDLVY